MTINWWAIPLLKKCSLLQFVLYCFVVYWTVQGTLFFIDSEKESKTKVRECIRDSESYAFWIAWSILNYFVVLVFAILLLTWYDIHQKSLQIRHTLLEIIRTLDLHTQEG